MSTKKLTSVYLAFFLVLCQLIQLEAQLEVGYYSTSCRMAEIIVRDEVRKGFLSDRGIAAALVRMHFHDCFVRVSKALFGLARKATIFLAVLYQNK